MGGYLNIEIHQKLKSNKQFITSIIEILKNSIDKEELNKFTNSIKLFSEENNYWFEYKKLKFIQKENDIIEWDIYLYFNQNEYNYVFELSVSENNIQIYDDEWPYFDNNKTQQILSLMRQIHTINKEAIIVFTNEASQGKFVEYLKSPKNDINYLFDLAILPTTLNWVCSNDKYDQLEEIEKGQILKSKSRYMRNFEPKRLN